MRSLCLGLVCGLVLISVLSHLCFGTGGVDREYLATRGYGQFLPETPWRVHGGPQRRPQLLILGSSKARNAFFADIIAEATGLPALNLAMSGFPLSGIPLQAQTVLADDPVAVRLVVIGVSRSDLLAGRYALRPLSACSSAIRAVEGPMVWARVCGERIMWQAGRTLLGLDPQRLRRQLLGLDTGPFLPERMAHCTSSFVARNADDLVLCEGGGILRTRAPVPRRLRRRQPSNAPRVDVDAHAVEVLSFVRAALQERRVALRIALLPEWTSEEGDFAMLEALRRHGFHVYDLTRSGGDSFYDPVHVNQTGGRALSASLVDALRRDRRVPVPLSESRAGG